jgi:hypothetical protein
MMRSMKIADYIKTKNTEREHVVTPTGKAVLSTGSYQRECEAGEADPAQLIVNMFKSYSWIGLCAPRLVRAG